MELYKSNASRILSCYKDNEDIFEKGGKRAQLGEVRVYNNGEKWKKTLNGWEQVHDIHTAKNGGYYAHVTKITPTHVEYEKHGRNGHMGTYGKMSHEDFKSNHTPKVIHEVSEDGNAEGTEHVRNYHKDRNRETEINRVERDKNLNFSDHLRLKEQANNKFHEDTKGKHLNSKHYIPYTKEEENLESFKEMNHHTAEGDRKSNNEY